MLIRHAGHHLHNAKAREFWLAAARDAMRWTEIDGKMVTLH
jgi:hypothetical protein